MNKALLPLIEFLDTLSRRSLLLGLSTIFVLLHLVYIASGITFVSDSLAWFWQYVDPPLLQHHLLESLFYLHSQPPLFNLFIGVVLKLAPAHYNILFWAVYLVMGLLFYLGLFALMRQLQISRLIALVLSTLFILSPSFVLFEHFLFYEFPAALLLLLSALAFYSFLEKRTLKEASLFFALLFLLSGIRSIYHLLYSLIVTGSLLVICSSQRKVVLRAALIPLLLLFSLYLKNYLLFDSFGTNSWYGMNVARITVKNMPLEERTVLVQEGKISPVSLVPPFAPLTSYPASYQNSRADAAIPALSRPLKSSGESNFNHIAYVSISQAYLHDSLFVLTHYPKVYLKGVLMAWFTYFKASDDYYKSNRAYALLQSNQEKLSDVGEVYDYLFYGKIPYDLSQIDSPLLAAYSDVYLYLALLLALPFLYGYVFKLMWRRSIPLNQRLLMGYLCFNIAYIALIGNSLEAGENNRFRFLTDPLYLALLGIFVQRALLPRLRLIGTPPPPETQERTAVRTAVLSLADGE